MSNEKKRKKSSRKYVTLLDREFPFQTTEAFKSLRANLIFSLSTRPNKVFAVTSAMQHEGKSTVAANLAITFAQMEAKVLVIDADLRKPAQSLIFSASPSPGTDLGYLITHRPDREALEKAIVRDEATGLSHLYAAPLRRSQSEALSPDSFRPLLDALRESYSYILIDTPPFSFFADAEVLADAADAAILVVRQDLVPAAVVNDTIDDLNAAHAVLLG